MKRTLHNPLLDLGFLMCLLWAIPAAWAATSSAESNIIPVDLRVVATGTLNGLVQAGGSPVAGAQVRLDGTAIAASTGADGRFTLANVPASTGYLLTVSAAGFASKSVTGVTVATGSKDLGVITLVALGGPYRLLPLQPDVNPAVTQIEEGGVGYRYYKVVSADSKTPAGGVSVSLQTAGGSAIAQSGDVSDFWPGRTAGVSDADGTVRVRIGVADVGGPGSSASVQVVVSGMVQQIFTAQVVPREYEQVWKKRWHGVAGVDLDIASGGLGFGHETTVTHEFGTAAGGKEVVGHWREEVYQAGVGVGLSLHVNRVGAGASHQTEGNVTIGLGQSLYFDPQTTDPLDNLLKFYAAYADALNFVPLGGTIIEGVQDQIMSMGGPVEANEGGLRVTGSAEADAGIGGLSPLPGDVALHFWADLSADVSAELGVEDHPSQYVDRYVEFGAGWARDVQWKLGPEATPVALFQDRDNSLRATVRRTADDRGPSELIVESSIGVTADTPRTVGGWLTDDLVQLRNQEVATYKNTCTLMLPSVSDALPMALNAWQAVNNLGQGSVFRSGNAAEMISSLLSAGQAVAYEKSAYSAETTVSTVLPKFDIVFSLDASAEDEAGAEIKKEGGVVWQNRLLALEAYSDQPKDYYPTETLSDLQGKWIANARSPLDQLLNTAKAKIVAGANTVIQAGSSTVNAVIQFGQGVMNDGSQIVSQWTASIWGGTPGPQSRRWHPVRPMAGSTNTPNLVYGIGGIYRFESTNSFNGTGTLTITYAPAEIVGFDAADLRIYRLPEGASRWQLVGGTVNTASNTVTATINQLGTYAAAPPMPTGDLLLVPGTNTLPADGVSQTTVTVTNILLNTGNVATQQWVFTALAAGVTLLNADTDPTTPGVQVISTNGAITLTLQAPSGGTAARVSLASVAGDATGTVAINLADNTPPATPAGVTTAAGQSRIWVSWQTNSEPDLAGYRVYYRLGQAGPPWDGTAAVEGTASPVMVTGTNCLLRGLTVGTNYFIAVSAVDTTGNESPLSATVSVTTTPSAPAPPTSVAVSFGTGGTNILMWALSEDDGYNDRDVAAYEVWRAVLPGGDYVQAGEAAAGVGLFSETNSVTLSPGQYLAYAVRAVAANGMASAMMPANRYLTGTSVVDSDGDGIPDWWTMNYFGHPAGQASDQSLAQDDPAGDGLSNLQKYLLGRNPLIWDNLHFTGCEYLANGQVKLTVFGQVGQSYRLQTTTDFSAWTDVTNFTYTGTTTDVLDPNLQGAAARFYRVVKP